MAESENNSSSSFRWWEFYAVRYGMGTVVGAVVFFFLCFTNPALKPLLFGADTWKIDGTRLALFGAYGLAFCYISSAPVLVFHAGRFLLQTKFDIHTTLFRLIMGLSLPVLLAMIAADHSGAMDIGARLFYAAAAFVFALIVWLQLIVVALALWKSVELYDFYVRLDDKRLNAKGEIVESYRHLREHGNSFFIVFLEIVFALVLFAAGNYEFVVTGKEMPKATYVVPYVIILLVWTFPAVLVWFIGTVIERRFCDSTP
ncbi:MAG: hypothetical protein PHU46_01035 [Rhodocyclaceae bacterium]|nr:hypothetical protein [Rhodocyclaceae bacterium]